MFDGCNVRRLGRPKGDVGVLRAIAPGAASRTLRLWYMDGPEALRIDLSIWWDAYVDMNDENFLEDIGPDFRFCRGRGAGGSTGIT
jgi:hypothetical protein